MALFALLGVLRGFRMRPTDVRLTANPCAALIRTKFALFWMETFLWEENFCVQIRIEF